MTEMIQRLEALWSEGANPLPGRPGRRRRNATSRSLS